LQGFDFNNQWKIEHYYFSHPYTVTLDRTTGNVTVNVPSFVQIEMITAPDGTTHFRLSLAGAEIDFENGIFLYIIQ
jgi:hypothetical protein